MDTLISAVGLRPQYLGDGQQEVVDGLLRVWFALVFGQKHCLRLALRVLHSTGGRTSERSAHESHHLRHHRRTRRFAPDRPAGSRAR